MEETSKVLATGEKRRYAPMPILEQEERLMTLAERRNWRFEVVGAAPIQKRHDIAASGWWPQSSRTRRNCHRGTAKNRGDLRPGDMARSGRFGSRGTQAPGSSKGTRILSPLEFWLRFLGTKSIQFGEGAAGLSGLYSESYCFCLLRWVYCFSRRRSGWHFSLSAALASTGGIDPCLIVCTDDNVWIVVHRWTSEIY